MNAPDLQNISNNQDIRVSEGSDLQNGVLSEHTNQCADTPKNNEIL